MLRNTKLGLRGVLVGLTDPCMLANTGLPKTLNFIAIRHPFVHYSGVIGIGVMSVPALRAKRYLNDR